METIIGAVIMLVGVLFGAGILLLGFARVVKPSSDNFTTNYYGSPFEEDGDADKTDEPFMVDATNLDDVLKNLTVYVSTCESVTSDEEHALEELSEALVHFGDFRNGRRYGTKSMEESNE